MKFFILEPTDRGDGIYQLITETGVPLASHWCSNYSYAKSDLEANRPERQKEWKEKYGDYEVLFFRDQTEITKEELLKRNKEWYDTLPEEEKKAQ